jgi:hypothetical protein
VEAVDALDLLAAIRRDGEPVTDLDPLEHQHAVSVEDLAGRFDVVPPGIHFDLTRLQRACERARQSTARRGNHGVERGGVRRIVVGTHAVVIGDLRVDTERDRLVLSGQVR